MNAPTDRAAALDRLGHDSFDVVVVGGGITGAGVLLDATARGLRAALVERHDFASGTSSRSSKLVHGGLRYLDQREFRLVYEALAERQVLLDNAPHLVEVQPFLFPLFAKGEGRGRRQAVRATSRAIGTALWLYDLTGGLRIGRRHHRVAVERAREVFPTLDAERLAAAYVYYDARADDARLTLAIVLTALHRYGAVAVNHVAATALRKTAGRITGVAVRDQLTGHETVVDAGVVVNAGGVWADEVRQLDEGSDPGTIRPAKGVHITVPAHRLPTEMAVVLPVPKDRRSIFVVPWNGEVYVGTTDSDYDGPLDEPVCTGDEVDYLLRAVNAWVTDPLTPDDVVGTWAGLRPLVRDADSERTADLSRRHAVRSSGSGLVTVTGGKLTTYRRMATDAVDAAFAVLGRPAPASPTRKVRLHGADGVEELLGDARGEDAGHADAKDGAVAAGRLGVSPALATHLVKRYGTDARAVAAMVARDPGLGAPLVPGLAYVRAEAVFAARYEMARTLEDVLALRTRALLLDRQASAEAAPEVARLLAPELGWDDAEVEAQVATFRSLVERLRDAARSTGTPVPPVEARLPE